MAAKGTPIERLNEWRDHRAHQRARIVTFPSHIRAAAQAFDVPKVRRIASELIDACDEYERTTKPIAEWEGIVVNEQGGDRLPQEG